MVIPSYNGYRLLEIAGLVSQMEDGRGQEFMSGIAGKPEGSFVGLLFMKYVIICNQAEEKAPLTRNDPQTRRSPSELMAADTLSPAAMRTARNFSSTKDCSG